MLCVVFYINLIYMNLIYIIKFVTKLVTAVSLIPNLVCLLRRAGLPQEPNCICYTCTQVFTVILKGLPGRF